MAKRDTRLKRERLEFESSICTFPGIKSAVWKGLSPDPAEESPSVTVVVEVVRELLNCFDFKRVFLHAFTIMCMPIRFEIFPVTFRSRLHRVVLWT